MDTTNLKAWLPFDESTTLDKCLNTWTATGDVSLSTEIKKFGTASVHLPSGAYLTANNVINLNADKWTFSAWCYVVSSSGDDGFFGFGEGQTRRGIIASADGIYIATSGGGSWQKRTSSVIPNVKNRWTHIEVDKNGTSLKFFQDGVLFWETTINGLNDTGVFLIGGNSYGYSNDVYFDEILFYEGVALHSENFTPPTAEDYANASWPITLNFDVERKVTNDTKFTSNLKVWLPFDTSQTLDKCGNSWTAHGTPTISETNAISGKALQITASGQYISLDDGLTLGGQDFTIRGHAYMSSSTTSYGRLFEFKVDDSSKDRLELTRYNGGGSLQFFYRINDSDKINRSFSSGLTNSQFDFEIDYTHADTTFRVLINGTLALTATAAVPRMTFKYPWIGRGKHDGGQWIGSVDEFMIYDGVALHTANFTPPTAEDYAAMIWPMTLNFDVQRKVKNAAKTWRYENAGTADTLINNLGYTLFDLPESKSVTGTAFYQTTSAKCFDLPTTNEIWIKFDVYFNGSNRWRAYNGGSNGITGITAQSGDGGELSFFANGTNVSPNGANIADICKANTLQTFLLHMRAGASSGVIEAWVDGEKIYTYTGDVNHGQDFADIYLQSDGAGTFFSNVIISNVEIDFGEGYQLISVDIERRISNVVEFAIDVERLVKNVVPFEFNVDVEIRDVLPVTFTADVVRKIQKDIEFTADVEILDVIPIEFTADVLRSIVTKIDTYVTDNSEYLQGGGSLPVVIPTPDVIPRQERNGVQSIEITIAEQQITEQVKVTGVIAFDVMSVVQGQYLDYVYDMRVERVQQQGILYSVDCCSNLDKLLYTQMAYTLPKNWVWQMQWRKAGEEPVTQDVETHYPPASKHVEKIAAALGLEAVMQFDDFLSTVLMENLGGVTYADLIRDVFGWSSRVPTQLINVYIRGGKLFVIQRGHEANVIDISGTKHTLPIYTRELVRTTWGSSPWSKSETREMQSHQYVPPDTAVDDSGGGDGGEKPIREVSTQFNGNNAQGYTTYTYDDAGRLIHTYTYVNQKNPFQNTYTNVDHVYDDDGTMIYTDTSTQSMGQEGESASRHVEEKYYITLPNGEKFLAGEYTATYQNDDGISISDRNLVDSKYTTHSPSRVGQSHTITINGDGDVSGSIVGQNTGDDRVTPFASGKARSLAESFETSEDSGWKTDTESRTVSGIALYDSSFPIHNENKLIAITNELKRLNRTTRETVTLSLYEFPHLIDFNDRVILDGAEYFLVSNRARSTSRLYNEQNLTLVRWY